MSEPQPRLYRPAWFLRLHVRLEDFGQTNDSDAQDGAQPYGMAKQLQLDQSLTAENQLALATVSGGYSKATRVDLLSLSKKLRRQAASGSAKSSAGDNGKADEFSVEFITTPMELTIEDKGFREADTLETSFPFVDMPLFPWMVREIRVEGWVGTVKSADFATPDRWHLEPRMSQTSVLRFNGYVDLTEMEADAEANTVHFKARSYVSVLIDGKINQHAKAYRMAGKQETITAYINRSLSLYPPTSGDTGGDPFRAYWYASPAEAEPSLDRKTLLRSLQTAKSRNQAMNQPPGKQVNAQQDPPGEAADPNGGGDAATGGTPTMPPQAVTADGMSVWDLITQACELCGVLPMYKPSLPPFKGPDGKDIDPANCLLVTPPEAFYDDISSAVTIKGGARDGFSREFGYGTSTGTFSSDVRFMVWGHNIAKMKLARHMGKVRPTAVEVRAYNPDASDALRVMSARFPLHNPKRPKGKGRSSHKMTEKGGGKIDVIRTFVLKGIRDQQALQHAAVAIYHQLCLPELTMGLETDELASYIDPVASQQAGSLVENHNDNPDILRLCAGTPVHVTVAKKSTDGADLTICSLSEFYDLAGDHIVDLLTKQNDRWGAFRTDGSLDQAKIEETARKIQAVYRAAKLPSVYYCKGVRLEFKATDEIFHCSMELANYMPSNDPSKMDEETQEINDQRKKKPTSKAAKAKQSEDAASQAVINDAKRRARIIQATATNVIPPAAVSSPVVGFTPGGSQ